MGSEMCIRDRNSGKVTGVVDGRTTNKEELGFLMTKTESKEEQ